MTAAAARFDGILWQIVSRSAAFVDDYVYSIGARNGEQSQNGKDSITVKANIGKDYHAHVVR